MCDSCRMLSKTLTSVLMRRLLASEFNVRTTVFTRWWAKKFFSVHSSSNYYTGKFDRLFENETAQKYFNFIEESDYYHRKVDATQRELFGTVIKLLQKKKQMEVELKSLGNMNSEGDREMEKLVEEEKESLANDLQQLKCEIFENILLICDDSYDDGFTEVQIIPAVGGDEAKLFAEELYNMYLNYISYKNWECLLSELRGEKSEIRCGYILLSGDSVVFNQIRHEAGVHRVQRVPVTEKSGRTHTSTCSVAVLRKPKTSDIILKDKDLIFETVRSSGPGGQNVNKLETCVKVKHIPTGIPKTYFLNYVKFSSTHFFVLLLKTILILKLLYIKNR